MPASAYILIVPLAAGALAYVFRRWQAIEVLIAAIACSMVIVVLLQPIDATFLGIDLDGRLNFLGRALQINPQDRLSLVLMFGSGMLLTAASWRTPENWTFVPIGLVMLGVFSATTIIRPIQYAGLGYVVAGALGALMIQAERSGERTTIGAMRFLVIHVLALPLFLGAGYFIQSATATAGADAQLAQAAFDPAVQFLIIGFALVIGAVPVFTWIHPVAKDAPPLTTAFLATVSQGAVTFLLLTFMRDFDWFRNASSVRTALSSGGVALLIIAAALGWAQKSFARVMACGLLAALGGTLLAINTGTQRGVEAAMLSIVARVLSLGLFGIGVALLRHRTGGDLFEAVNGIGLREPWIALAVGLGGLSMVGLPGTIGFVAMWTGVNTYDTNAELVLIQLLASISVAIGMLTGLSALFRGDAQASAALVDQQRGEQLTIAIGTVLVIGLGIFPNIIAPLIQAIAENYGR